MTLEKSLIYRRLSGTNLRPTSQIIDPEVRDKSIEMGRLEAGERKTATWKVRLKGVDSAKAEISVLSTRGGVDRREVELKWMTSWDYPGGQSPSVPSAEPLLLPDSFPEE